MQFVSSLRSFELPLLFKELIERAQRRRTYVVRMFAAILLYAWVLVANYKILLSFDPLKPDGSLGQGKLILETMVLAETVGLYLCLPALCCGVIAGEKENNTLPLLFVTRLSPWTIVFEKYLSCVVMAICFLLLSIPCMMIAYPLGGLSFSDIILAAWTLILTSCVVIAISLLSSVWCRTVAGAIVLGYVLNVLAIAGPFFIGEMIFIFEFWRSFVLEMFPRTRYAFFFPFSLYFFSRGWGGISGILSILYYSLPSFLQIYVCLCLTRFFLIRRSEGQGRNWLRIGFGKLDSLYKRINNNRLTRGIVVTRKQFELPENHPVAWRETTRSALANPAHLIRLWGGLFTPPAIVFLFSPISDTLGWMGLITFIYVLLAILSLVVKSSTLISSERSHQTLGVLLVTPISPRELLHEKMRGIWRLYFVLISILFPLLAIFWWMMLDYWKESELTQNTWISFSLSMLIFQMIDFPLMIWLSVLVGLKLHSPGKSVITSLGVIFVWWVLPVILTEYHMENEGLEMQWMFYPYLFVCPLAMLQIGIEKSLFPSAESICVWYVIMAVYYLIVLFVLRFWILRNAGRFLSRLEPSTNWALQSSA